MSNHICNILSISIHAPARGATIFRYRQLLLLLFQSTLPRGERQERKLRGLQKELFQSTLPRGERQESVMQYHMGQTISIHAPARGATSCERLLLHWKMYFNPRSREGSDVSYDEILVDVCISIHAPARGATM